MNLILYNNTEKHLLKYTNCDTHNVIYGILCRKCNLLYIGKTTDPIKTRIGSHLSCIKNKYDDWTLYRHFQDDSCLKSFFFFVLDNNPYWSGNKILKMEGSYQKKFQTIQPLGLNDLENITISRYDPYTILPHGTAGKNILQSFLPHSISFSSFKSLNRLFYQQKLCKSWNYMWACYYI